MKINIDIKTIRDLKKIINNLDDDFEVNFSITTYISEEDLSNMDYPYPIKKEKVTVEFDDIGYSDKVVSFSVFKKEGVI